MKDPIISTGLIFASRIKRQEGKLMEAYFNLGVWMRDEWPKLQGKFTLHEFATQAEISRTTLYKTRQVAEAYGTFDNVPDDYKFNTAWKFRGAFGQNPLPAAPKIGGKPFGMHAAIVRSEKAISFLRSAHNGVAEAEEVTPDEFALLEENAISLRAEINDMLRAARQKLVPAYA